MRRIIIGIMIICILAATGCGSNNDTEPMTKEIVQVDGFENTEYKLETDYQYYFNLFRDVGGSGYIMFDKDQIGIGNHEWIELPIN